MKMIKLLVLLSGKVKIPSYAKTGKVYVDDDVIGAVYSVSKDVYKNRRTSSIKKLLVNSIHASTFSINR